MDRFKLMETFIVVVREGSYTRAARKLEVTRAMVSKRIQELEAMLGIGLMHRDTHGIKITGIGAEYYESCVKLLAQLSANEERARNEVITPRGDLKILAPKTFGDVVLAPLIAGFCLRYPEISLQFTLADRHLEPDTSAYDFVLGSLPSRDSALMARAIVSLPRILVASPGYIDMHGLPQAPADLTDHNCLDPSGSGRNTWEFRAKSGRKRVHVSGTLRTNTSAVVHHAALRGVGIAILRQYLVAEDIKRGRLKQILSKFELDKRALYALYPKDHHMPMRMQVFLDYLDETFKEQKMSVSDGDAPSRPNAKVAAIETV